MEDKIASATVGVPDCLVVLDGDAVEVDTDSVESVEVNDEVEVITDEDSKTVLAVSDELSVVDALFDVSRFVGLLSLLLSSPQRPASQGSVEQQPLKAPFAQV